MPLSSPARKGRTRFSLPSSLKRARATVVYPWQGHYAPQTKPFIRHMRRVHRARSHMHLDSVLGD